jgi:hypothetical protein
MPFINNRFYMNPAYGRALERARAMKNRLVGTTPIGKNRRVIG